MIQSHGLWDFTELVSVERRRLMVSARNWTAVLNVFRSHLPVFVGFEPRHDDLGVGGINATRASVRIEMPEDDADLVYNSPIGLRAQYCLDTGVQRNRELIDALIPACVCTLTSKSRELAEKSLRGVDAKVCLNKDDIPTIAEIHINYAPWIERLGQGERLAETGVLAPRIGTLWIKGAWVLDGCEWRDPLKADRSEKFKRYGFG